jgi:hypothetical protein
VKKTKFSVLNTYWLSKKTPVPVDEDMVASIVPGGKTDSVRMEPSVSARLFGGSGMKNLPEKRTCFSLQPFSFPLTFHSKARLIRQHYVLMSMVELL